MIRAKRRLRLWGGHLLLVPLAICVLTTLWFIREALRGMTPDEMFWNSIAAMVSFLFIMIFGILSAALYNTDRERYHLRAMWAADDAKASGVPRTTEADGSPVSVAYSPDDEDIY